MTEYVRTQLARNVPLRILVRPLMGLVHGQSGARGWRRTLSDPEKLAPNDASVLYEAWRALGLPVSSSA